MTTPTTMTCREAMRQAIREALIADDRVFMMGEDIGAYGGSARRVRSRTNS
jgi:pyruvate/2-oxoglutarate/acetoin dehydrogenase E1 component